MNYFSEENLLETRLRDIEVLCRGRKTNIDFNTKRYAMMYYSLTLASLCDTVCSAIAKFNKFCTDYLYVNPNKDKQAIFYQEEMVARIEAKEKKMLVTRYIIQNLRISKKEQERMKLLIDEETSKERAKKRIEKLYGSKIEENKEKINASIKNKSDELFDGLEAFDEITNEDDDLPF